MGRSVTLTAEASESRGEIEGTRELTCQGHRIIYVVADGGIGLSNVGDITVLEIFGPGQSRTK